MRLLLARVSGLAVALSCATASNAGMLHVAPTTLDLVAPEAAATLNLRNDDAQRSINVQIRVFRWTQRNGADRLEPTSDVVASPPAQTLMPKADYVVRVVRVAKQPIAGEESYRVVVDELPDPARRKAGVVDFVLRYSLPVFFRSPDAGQPQISWAVQRDGDKVRLPASNSGQQRLTVAAFELIDGANRSVRLSAGLVGYVLGNAAVQWSFPAKGMNLSLSGQRFVTLSAQSDGGPIHAMAAVQAGR